MIRGASLGYYIIHLRTSVPREVNLLWVTQLVGYGASGKERMAMEHRFRKWQGNQLGVACATDGLEWRKASDIFVLPVGTTGASVRSPAVYLSGHAQSVYTGHISSSQRTSQL